MLEKMERHDFDKVFGIMEDSFPIDEFRTYGEQKALLDHPCYQIYVARGQEGEGIKAFLTIWEFEEIIFIEHFAVEPSRRGSGMGSRMLGELS